MYTGTIDIEFYNQKMKDLRQLSSEFREIYLSDIYIKGRREYEKRKMIEQGRIFELISNYIVNHIDGNKLSKSIKKFSRKVDPTDLTPNYFSNERIAVYTCIFGRYDKPFEPISHPNNIDYYIITDQKTNNNTCWTSLDYRKYSMYLDGLDNVEKNRWFKMHPDVVFPEYKFSIYVDGNVQIITDFTEFINRIGNPGIAMFWHKYNNCVYQEALFNKYSVKKVNSSEIDNQIIYLRNQGMPDDYGMTTCNVIAREHGNEICKKIMNDWWNEFLTHCKRDQLSFPYVVWKNGISMSDIATLGNDVWNTDTLLVRFHD